MKTSGFFLFVFIVISLLTSCEKEAGTSEREGLSPIGMTFEGCVLSITFESAGSVRFHPLKYPDGMCGKARYLHRGHTIEIVNPYGRRLPPEQVEEAYFVTFVGEINSSDRLEHVRLFFLGPDERLHISGDDMTLWRVKDKEQ